MTREEAINELSVIYERLSHTEECANGVYSFADGDYLEAIEMAIDALSEPKSYNIKCEKGSTVTFVMSKKHKAEREQPDYCIAYRNGVCCYPIEACCDCPKHEYYRNLERGKR